ncbi:MAG TPA: hypothetical protein VFR08_02530, partial [Candidatus Angelobacter sp.]|nr:hypothetical protein [Candidatus Angelobacter sp.]
MYRVIALLSFCLMLAAAAWSQQQDMCAGYQDSPDAPHKGPRKFNVIHLGFASGDSALLVVDPQGHRFGVDNRTKAARREISRAFYEDDNTAENDTGLSPVRKPREITLHYAQSGAYLIVLTARRSADQWLKVRTSTCGKRWQKEITVAASKGAASTFTLIYDAHAGA